MRAFYLLLLSLSFIAGCNRNLIQSSSYSPQVTPPSSENSDIPMLLVMTNVGIGEYVLDNGLITNATPSNYTIFNSSTTATAFTLSPTLPYLYLTVQNPANEIWQFSLDASTGLPVALSPGGTMAASYTPIAIGITPNNALAFVLNNSIALATNSIDIYTIDSTTGALTSVGGTTVTSPGGAGLIVTLSSLTVTTDSQYLYVSAFATDNTSIYENFIMPFSISGATLTPGENVLVSYNGTSDIIAMAIATTPSGNSILYAAENQTTNIGIFLITSGGALIPQTSFTPPQRTTNIVIPAGGSYLYALGRNGTLYSYAIDPQTGALSALTSYSGPFAAIGLAADSKYLYATDSSTSQYTYSFTINNDGTLTQTDALVAACAPPALSIPTPILASNVMSFTYTMCKPLYVNLQLIRAFKNTADILSLPNYQPIISLGGYSALQAALSSENNLYTVSNTGSDALIYQMTLDPTTGTLSTLAPTITLAGEVVIWITLFNSKYLYIKGENNFYQYNVASGGALTGGIETLPGGSLSVQAMAATSSLPVGAYFYALTTGPNTIYQYSIDESSGTLNLLTPPTPGGVTLNSPQIIIIPAGQTFAYVIDIVSLIALSIDSSGQLSTNGAPIAITAGGVAPLNLTVTPTLSFIYVLGNDANIYQFAINSDGTISALTPEMIPTGQGGNVSGLLTSMTATSNTLFIAFPRTGTILEYAIGSDGQLSFVSSITSELNSNFLIVAP